MHEQFPHLWPSMQSIRLSEEESSVIKEGILHFAEAHAVRKKADVCHKGCMDPRHFLRQKAKTVKLSADEDGPLRESIMHFAQMHEISSVPAPATARMWNMIRYPLVILRPVPFAAALLLFIACGAGVSFAAQAALPGDFLYPVKVHFNERAQAAFYFSADSRAHFEAARLETRLEEAAKLAASGQLQGNRKMLVSEGIKTQLQLTQEASASLAESGDNQAALDLHSQIESDLLANAAVLASMTDASKNTMSDVQALLQDVSQAAFDVQHTRADTAQQAKNPAVDHADSKADAEKSIQVAVMAMEQAEAFITSKPAADASILIQANGRMAVAKRVLSNARQAIDAGNFDVAVLAAGNAQRAAREAKTMLSVSSNIRSYLHALPAGSSEASGG